MPRVTCARCGKIGNLTTKKTKTRGVTYEYYYVQHYLKETDKIEWCYLGSYDKLPREYREKLEDIHKDYTQCTQHKTTNTDSQNKLKNHSVSESSCSATSFAQMPVLEFAATSFKYSFHEMSTASVHSSYFWTMFL